MKPGFGTRDILAPGKLVFGVAVGEKQTAWLRVRARGTAAQGSQPIPDNANVTLLNAPQKAMSLPGAKPHLIVAEMIRPIGSPLASNKYTAAIVAPMLVRHGTDSVKLQSKESKPTEHIPVSEFLSGLFVFYDLLSSEH